MAFMEWSREFETGVEHIDNDHQTLFAFVNDLHDKYVEGEGDAAIEATLAGLVNYVNVHFAREEAYMKELNYPDLAIHRKMHGSLADQVLEMRTQFRDDPAQVDCAELLAFLKNWLTNHILLTDMDYVEHARRKDAGSA